MPSNRFRCGDEIERRRRQRGHVQGLADMARGIGPVRVFVEERAARCKIEQCHASQYRQRALRRRSSEKRILRVHKRHFSLAFWTGGEASWLQ